MAAHMPPQRATWALAVLIVTMATMSSTAEAAHSDGVPGHLLGAELMFAQSGADASIKTQLKGLKDGVYPSAGSNTDRYAPLSPHHSKMSTRDQHVFHYPDGSEYELTSEGVLKPIGSTLGGSIPLLNKPPPQQPLAPEHTAPPTVIVIRVPYPSRHRPLRPVYRPRPPPWGYAPGYMNYAPGFSLSQYPQESWGNDLDFSNYPPRPVSHKHSQKPSWWWDDDDNKYPSHGWGPGGSGHTGYWAGGSKHPPEEHDQNNNHYSHGWPYVGRIPGSSNYQYPPYWVHWGSKHPPGEEHHHQTNYPTSWPYGGSNHGSSNYQYPPYWTNGSDGSKYPPQGNDNSYLYPTNRPYDGTTHPPGWEQRGGNSNHLSAPHVTTLYPARPDRPPCTLPLHLGGRTVVELSTNDEAPRMMFDH